MFASLRSRLWLSYALLVGVLLCVVAAGLVWAFWQSPLLLYPEAAFRMRLAGEVVPAQLEKAQAESLQRAQRLLDREALDRSMRFVLAEAGGKIILDTGGDALPLSRAIRASVLRAKDLNSVHLLRTGRYGVWLYLARRMENGQVFLALQPAPSLPLGILFRDRFVSTFLYAGLAALLLALFLALTMSRSITGPLNRMATASRSVAQGEYPSVPVEGPLEVQALARAMNEMSRQVQAGQQSQRDFIANVSHELKTPLTSIQGFAQAILDGAAQTPDALQQAAGVIYNEAARMHRLVLDLLSLARLEAGTADLQFAPVDLDLLLHGVLEKFTPQAQAAQVELRGDGSPGQPQPRLPAVNGDGDRLAQVFTNLVDNAIKFTPPGGVVTVEARVDGYAGNPPAVLVQVTDSGPGISAEDCERIFDRFYQVDRSRKGGAGRGYGLGLPIARQIIQAHGGKIWVESHPGQGSCFVVKIPLTRAFNNHPAARPTKKA